MKNYPFTQSSSNNIINGVSTRSDILKAWDRAGSDIPAIYGKFGVTRADIAALPSRPNVTITSNQHDFWSIGRNSLSGYSGISEGYKDSEVRLRAGGSTFYMRDLNAWGVSSYRAFKGHVKSTGKQFWIIANCGNFTQLGKETPAKPNLEIRKSVIGGKTTAIPGETFTYRVEYRNSRDDSLAEGVSLRDDLDSGYVDRLAPTNYPMSASGVMVKNIGNMGSTDNSRIFDVTVRVKPNIAAGTNICNLAKLVASNAPTVVTPKICVTVVTPQAPQATPTPLPPQPEVPPGSTKDVKNITQNLEGKAAIESKVQAGDVIEYKLITANSNATEKTNYDVVDYVGDVLEYADLDKSFLASQGGSFNETTNQVIWSKQTLPANGQLEKKFRVTLKNPIPGTNSPTQASTTFDCKISNKYGDEISLQVECPVLKTVETLPNTGPGEAIGVSFTLTTFAGYFLARNKLLTKELGILRRSYSRSAQ
ncbi:hypothetical protein HZB74_01115 [Candidatus Saccharibacteria bacterium]|nr:hypothetical protein [Candidatus Saccharibacteria bacterium]